MVDWIVRIATAVGHSPAGEVCCKSLLGSYLLTETVHGRDAERSNPRICADELPKSLTVL